MKIKRYIMPKTLVYSGKHKQEETKIRHFLYNEKDVFETNDMKRKEGYKSYIQVIGLADENVIQSIKSIYSVDDLIIEDILNVSQGVKIDCLDKYLFCVVHSLFKLNKTFQKEYMSMICFENTVISFHEQNPWYLEGSIDYIQHYPDIRTKSSDYLFYHILDFITDNHIDIFNELNMVINEFEDVSLNEQILPQESFYRVRKTFIQLKNNVYYLLIALQDLMKKNHQIIKEDSVEYFHDLMDHLYRLDGQINLSRDNLKNLVDVNMNNQNNRMNQIMTTLTLFSAIFIPLSFFTGFFGMNFVHFEILTYPYAVGMFVGFCMLLIGFMIWLFKHKKWL